MLSLVAIAILLPLSSCLAGDPCPPKTDLPACTCSHLNMPNGVIPTTITPRRRRSADISTMTPLLPQADNGTIYTVVECKVAKTLSALEETVSAGLHRKLVDKLIVSNVPPKKEHTLANLPGGWLKTVRVKDFQVRDSMLAPDFIWKNNPFEGQAQCLLWLAANRCYLTGSVTYETAGTVNTKGLSNLPRIQGIDFSYNHLTFISSTSFRYPPTNLSTVILSRNSIQVVEAGAFQYIPLLRNVDLSHNLIQSLIRSAFPSSARHLERLDISWNMLTMLPTDFFANMPVLKTVDVSNNFLYSLAEKPWILVWRQLSFIDVTGNFIECDCSLLWLLPILSPPGVNSTTTPVPKVLPGQTVRGKCSRNMQPKLFVTHYDLVTLTRDKIQC